MPLLATRLLRIFPSFSDTEKVICFHCAESVRKKNVIMSQFDGKMRPLCCHGCVAVLKLVEQNNLIQQYYDARDPSQK